MIRRKNNFLFIFGFFIVIAGLLLILLNFIIQVKAVIKDEISINEFLNHDQQRKKDNFSENIIVNNKIYNYIAVIEIPKINLKKGLFSINDKNNNVNKGLEILKKPSIIRDLNFPLVIAGHSGNGKISFFKNLYKLKLKDKIFIYYNHTKYIYEIESITYQEKNGFISFPEYSGGNKIILTTCDKFNQKQQLVISATMMKQ